MVRAPFNVNPRRKWCEQEVDEGDAGTHLKLYMYRPSPPLFDVSASRENLSQSSREPLDRLLSGGCIRHYNRLSVRVDESGQGSASSSPWHKLRASTVARSKEELFEPPSIYEDGRWR